MVLPLVFDKGEDFKGERCVPQKGAQGGRLALSNTAAFPAEGMALKVSGALLSAWLLCPPAFRIQSSAPWLCKSAIDQAWLGAFFFFPFLTSLRCFELPSHRRHSALEE